MFIVAKHLKKFQTGCVIRLSLYGFSTHLPVRLGLFCCFLSLMIQESFMFGLLLDALLPYAAHGPLYLLGCCVKGEDVPDINQV